MKLINLSLLLICCFILVAPFNGEDDNNERKTYIVYMGELPENQTVDEHHNLLKSAIGDEDIARGSKLHSYGKSFNGFVAKLLPHEANWLSEHESVVSVFLNRKLKLHTTRSWDFLGMDEKIERNHRVESNIIVGLLDTGINVESPSFNDEGYGPPPAKWKGKCQSGANFTGCNNKVIGAQYFDVTGNGFPYQDMSPADYVGHGTHTSSTAAGGVVRGANLYGLGNGTARGGVPSARVAMYKVCWGEENGCPAADMLAGFDAAIADGVDIISISIGGESQGLWDNPIAIGSFHALKRGILTAASAGNDGLFCSVENGAPWLMTVAASSSDRKYQTRVRLGDGTLIPGHSVSTFSLAKKMYPLLNGERARNTSGEPGSGSSASACSVDALSAEKVKGKIVYCVGTASDESIQSLGGLGTITASDYLNDTAFPVLIPAATISPKQGHKVDAYINSTKAATAYIEKTEIVNITDGPFIASFSSRGPQMVTPNILKPDISAPGIDILAAYTSLASVTGEDVDRRFVKYNVMSGTSMACPHAAAAAAYIKTMKPSWSVAAIKSALITTAKPMKVEPYGAEFASGAGLMDPVRALNPGLIYDIDMDSYISFLCKEGYNSTEIRLISGSNIDCWSYPTANVSDSDGLNYPTMSVMLADPDIRDVSEVFYRTVTYVGQNKTVFKARVRAPKGLSVTVKPKTLSFTKPNEKQSFQVSVEGRFIRDVDWYMSASLEWSDSNHNVKSPIMVYTPSMTNG